MPIVNSSYKPENNFQVFKITIRGSSQYVLAENSIVGLTVYESIHDMVDAQLLIKDHSGLVDRLALTGNELVDIQFASRTGNKLDRKYTKTFRINNYQRMMDSIGVNELIEFTLISPSLIENNLIKKSKAFVNKTVAQCVAEVLGEMPSLSKTDKQIEDTLFTRTYHSPLMRPFDIIHDIKRNCASKTTKSCTFYFYEDVEGIKFKSLGAMKQSTPIYTIANEAKGASQFATKENGRISATTVYTKYGYSIHDTTRNGKYGARTISHSLVRKKITTHDLTRDKFLVDSPLMNAASQRQDDHIRDADKPFNAVHLVPDDGNYENDGSGSSGHVASIHTMEVAQIVSKDIVIKIPGNTNIKCGDTVFLDHLSISSEAKSYIASGKWLVTKVKHSISPSEYYTTMEVMSDSDLKETT